MWLPYKGTGRVGLYHRAMQILRARSARPVSWQMASLPHTRLAARVIQTPVSAKSQIITGQEPSAKEEGMVLKKGCHH